MRTINNLFLKAVLLSSVLLSASSAMAAAQPDEHAAHEMRHDMNHAMPHGKPSVPQNAKAGASQANPAQPGQQKPQAAHSMQGCAGHSAQQHAQMMKDGNVQPCTMINQEAATRGDAHARH